MGKHMPATTADEARTPPKPVHGGVNQIGELQRQLHLRTAECENLRAKLQAAPTPNLVEIVDQLIKCAAAAAVQYNVKVMVLTAEPLQDDREEMEKVKGTL
jgi:hypothetical protein